MNKKILFLILLGFIVTLPVIALAANVQDTADIAESVKNLATDIGIAIVVIGWVITGILYLTAGGAPDKTGTAKKALIACVIGTAVIILANAGYETFKQIICPILYGDGNTTCA
jgi:uncharacterized membrane protein (DUF485 family)